MTAHADVCCLTNFADNTIPIQSFFSDVTDLSLLNLLTMLDALQFCSDVRLVLKVVNLPSPVSSSPLCVEGARVLLAILACKYYREVITVSISVSLSRRADVVIVKKKTAAACICRQTYLRVPLCGTVCLHYTSLF